MFGKVVCFLAALAYTTTPADTSFVGVDPNTLSCDPLGQVFLLLPSFDKCENFYMCTHGQEVQFKCSGGLWFDFEKQTCNWPRDTKCWLRTREEEEIEGSGSGSGEEPRDFEWLNVEEQRPEVQPEGAIASITGKVRVSRAAQPEPQQAAPAAEEHHFSAILNCNEPSAAARQIPYKGDCQRYWRCIDRLPQAMYCSDGLFFNAKSQQCDYEANVSCDLIDDELQSEFIVYK